MIAFIKPTPGGEGFPPFAPTPGREVASLKMRRLVLISRIAKAADLIAVIDHLIYLRQNVENAADGKEGTEERAEATEACPKESCEVQRCDS